MLLLTTLQRSENDDGIIMLCNGKYSGMCPINAFDLRRAKSRVLTLRASLYRYNWRCRIGGIWTQFLSGNKQKSNLR